MAKPLPDSDGPSGVVDLVRAVAPGLSLRKIFADVADELTHQGRQGAHELAAALLRDHAGFILYPRQEGPPDGPGVHGPEASAEARERERGGLER